MTLKEHDIRPEALFARYVELSAADAHLCLDNDARVRVRCVGCGQSEGRFEFDKFGFTYVSCECCGTLFLNPRPSTASLAAFYRESPSARYWAEVFFPAVAEIRREKMFRPRVERVARLCAERTVPVKRLLDVGAGYGIFLEEWRARFPGTEVLAVEPSDPLARTCRSKGIAVIADVVENVRGYEGWADLVTCFEVLEHVHSPHDFVAVLARLVRPGGYLCVSTLCIDGFDLQMLWDRSTQISPPHHINFLSVRGFEELFSRAGLEDVWVFTPGQLDVDIVKNAATRAPDFLAGHRFLRTVIEREGTRFQEFLAQNRLSSHAWILGRRANGPIQSKVPV